jgi:hypothetical protein
VTTATVAGTTTTSAPGTTTTSTPTGGNEGGSASGPTQGVEGRTAVSGAHAASGELPFTGFPAWILALAGAALCLTGLGIRRFAD